DRRPRAPSGRIRGDPIAAAPGHPVIEQPMLDRSAAQNAEQSGWRPLVEKFANWLDRHRIGQCCAVLLVLELAVFLFIVAGTHGWIVPLERPSTTDFASFYAAGVEANACTPE